MKKVVVIVGPTAVGKTDFAFEIAKAKNGALVSADAVQVFKTLDIISGKDIDISIAQKKTSYNLEYYSIDDIDVYLLDLVDPTNSFSVSQFQDFGNRALHHIIRENKLPIIVGGTGLYIKSLVDGIETASVQPDFKLREKLHSLELEEIQNMLRKLDSSIFESMNESDKKNKRRLVRKMEIIQSGQRSIERSKSEFEYLVIGLKLSRGELKKRISKRVEDRIRNGALKEARKLFKDYKNLSSQVTSANGYRQLFEYFLGEIAYDQAIEKWKLSEYKHAKNQMTWFQKDARVVWFDVGNKSVFESIEQNIDTFLRT